MLFRQRACLPDASAVRLQFVCIIDQNHGANVLAELEEHKTLNPAIYISSLSSFTQFGHYIHWILYLIITCNKNLFILDTDLHSLLLV